MEGIGFNIWGLGGAVAVFAVVELLKRVWLDKEGQPVIRDHWAVIAAVAAGLILSTAAYFAPLYPIVNDVVNIIGAGLLAGLAAGGVFGTTKLAKK